MPRHTTRLRRTWSWLLIFAGQGRRVEREPGPVFPAQDLHDLPQLRRYRVQADRPAPAGVLAGSARAYDGAEPGQVTELDAAQVDVYIAVVVEGGQPLQEQRIAGLINVAGDDQPGLIVGLGDAQRLLSHGAAILPGTGVRIGPCQSLAGPSILGP
jgi:hypothetical protein